MNSVAKPLFLKLGLLALSLGMFLPNSVFADEKPLPILTDAQMSASNPSNPGSKDEDHVSGQYFTKNDNEGSCYVDDHVKQCKEWEMMGAAVGGGASLMLSSQEKDMSGTHKTIGAGAAAVAGLNCQRAMKCSAMQKTCQKSCKTRTTYYHNKYISTKDVRFNGKARQAKQTGRKCGEDLSKLTKQYQAACAVAAAGSVGMYMIGKKSARKKQKAAAAQNAKTIDCADSANADNEACASQYQTDTAAYGDGNVPSSSVDKVYIGDNATGSASGTTSEGEGTCSDPAYAEHPACQGNSGTTADSSTTGTTGSPNGTSTFYAANGAVNKCVQTKSVATDACYDTMNNYCFKSKGGTGCGEFCRAKPHAEACQSKKSNRALASSKGGSSSLGTAEFNSSTSGYQSGSSSYKAKDSSSTSDKNYRVAGMNSAAYKAGVTSAYGPTQWEKVSKKMKKMCEEGRLKDCDK